jgi:hypothetical protein
MSQIEIIPVRAFADKHIWTLRDERIAAVVDPGDAQAVLDCLDREKLELTGPHIAFYGAGMLYCGDTYSPWVAPSLRKARRGRCSSRCRS